MQPQITLEKKKTANAYFIGEPLNLIKSPLLSKQTTCSKFVQTRNILNSKMDEVSDSGAFWSIEI